jgi:iron complex outermembrane receptor protein
VGQTYGCEFTADFQMLEGWRLHAGYDWLKEDIRVKPGLTDTNNGLGNTADPENQVFLRSSMNLFESLELDLGGRWVDVLHNISNGVVGTVPSYFEMDARVGWRPTKNLELSVVGHNLLQDHHPEYGYPSPTREEITRSVYGKITCEF